METVNQNTQNLTIISSHDLFLFVYLMVVYNKEKII